MISTCPRRDQAAQAVDVFGLVLDQPFHQRPAGVQGDGDFGILLEQFEEGPVAVAVGVLEDAVEVADGLMIVQGEDKAKRHGRILSTCRAAVLAAFRSRLS